MESYNSEHRITLPNKLMLEQIMAHTGQGKCVRIPVAGNSMKPFLQPGDQVLLKPVEKGDLRLGMILLVDMRGAMILHRLVKFDQECIWLAGDANMVQHEELQHGCVLGQAVRLFRGDKVVKLDQLWRYKQGQLWYRLRPLRRVIKKIWSI